MGMKEVLGMLLRLLDPFVNPVFKPPKSHSFEGLYEERKLTQILGQFLNGDGSGTGLI